MKRSRKISAASIAALTLPLAGAGVAAAQQLTADPAPVVVVETPDAGSAIRSTTPKSPTALAVVAQAAAAVPASADTGIDPMRGWSEDDLDVYAAYWDAGYNYEQLLVLAEEWNMSEFEAKAQAGNAILGGDTSGFDALVEGIAPGPSEVDVEPDSIAYPDAAFWDAGYLYEDAVALAEAWNTDSYQAKVLAAAMIADGNLAEIEAVLGEV